MYISKVFLNLINDSKNSILWEKREGFMKIRKTCKAENKRIFAGNICKYC